jgi:hypothetical protein
VLRSLKRQGTKITPVSKRCEAPKMVVMKRSVFWGTMPLSLLKYGRRFGASCCLRNVGAARHYIPEDRTLPGFNEIIIILKKHDLTDILEINWEPGQRSRYSDWLRAGRPRVRSSSPGWGKIFLLSNVVETGSGTHPAYPLRSGGSFPGGKAAGTWSWPLTSN